MTIKEAIKICDTYCDSPRYAKTCLHCQECVQADNCVFECLILHCSFFYDEIPDKPCIDKKLI